jgi:hypothetical protein
LLRLSGEEEEGEEEEEEEEEDWWLLDQVTTTPHLVTIFNQQILERSAADTIEVDYFLHHAVKNTNKKRA